MKSSILIILMVIISMTLIGCNNKERIEPGFVSESSCSTNQDCSKEWDEKYLCKGCMVFCNEDKHCQYDSIPSQFD